MAAVCVRPACHEQFARSELEPARCTCAQAPKAQPKAAPVAKKEEKEVDTRAIALHKAGVTAAGLTGTALCMATFGTAAALAALPE